MTEKRMGLRSQGWFGGDDLNGVIHRGWMRSEGLSSVMFDGRPVIGVVNSWSEGANCNVHLRGLAEAVKRGVLRAGGLPLEVPAMSLSEPLMKPTTMLYRNLLSMEVEELIRAYPFDAVVLLSSCDKTTPGMLMGAASADIPAILITGGPMLRGRRGLEELPGATAVWEASDRRRAGEYSDERWVELESCVARSAGHCGVMGTASTMALLSEALGMALPGSGSIPAVDSRRAALAETAGARVVEMAIAGGPRPSEILGPAAFENAMTVLMAISGSTNAVVHLAAIAGRVRIPIALADFDRVSRRTPCLVDVRPAGRYQMEDFFYAGGLAAVMGEIRDLLHLDAPTITGRTIGQEIEGATILDPAVIRARSTPLAPEGGLAILWGNLAPRGALIKQSAMDPALRHHVGRAVVFRDKADLMERIDDPGLEVDPDSVLIRISDARMSGTAYGACVLHVAPESAIGGPLALVRDGDRVELDVERRRLSLLVPDDLLAKRRAAWSAPEPRFSRGYGRLYVDHVGQADTGADFEFLAGGPGDDWAPYRPTSH